MVFQFRPDSASSLMSSKSASRSVIPLKRKMSSFDANMTFRVLLV